MIEYAWVLVDMQLDGSFPKFFEFFNEHDVLIRQKVQYEWIPVKCLFCGMYGHEEVICKKNDGARKEWWIQQPVQVMTQGNTVPVTQSEGGQIDSSADYTPITKGPSAVRSLSNTSP